MSCKYAFASLASLLAVLPAPALAEPAENTGASTEPAAPPAVADDAKARFDDAVRLYKAEKVEEALPLFERLVAETDSPNARLYIGYCLAKLGRHVDAYRAFSQTVNDVAKRSDDRYESTRRAAWSELAAITPRVAKLVVALAEVPPGLRWSVDGIAMDPAALGTEIVLVPGDHRVEAVADGRRAVQRDVAIAGGESKTITFALERSDAAPATAAAASPKADDGSTLRVLGFVAGGVGVAGFSVFAIAGLGAKGVHDDLAQDCENGGCTDAEHRDDASRGKTLQTVANVGLVGGVLGTATGGVLLWLGFSNKESGPEVAWRNGGGTITYRGRF